MAAASELDVDARLADFTRIATARRSAYAYLPDPVPRTVVDAAIGLAMLAPNHHRTRPWRFFVYAGRGRETLVRAYEGAARRLGRDVARARQRALDAPVMIVVACMPETHPKVRRNEEEFATAAAVQNMLLAFAAAGVSTLITTGDLAESAETHQMIGLDREKGRIMAVVNAGYRDPERPLPPRPALDPAAYVTWSEMP
jgi:nitroreductase